MDNYYLDKLKDVIPALLSEKYPNYTFKEIYEDSGIHFLNERYIRIRFWDWTIQRTLWVGLSVSEPMLLNPDILLIEELTHRIDNELKKFKEGKS